MTDGSPVVPPRLGLVRVGSFSGSGLSLLAALERKVPVDDFDVLTRIRSPRMLVARLGALAERAAAGGGVPVAKTGAWSRGIESVLSKKMNGSGPVLFVQTTTACTPSNDVRYGIYTDRVGREGSALDSEFRSRSTSAWDEREARFLREAHRIFTMGPSTRNAIVDLYGIPSDRVRVVGAGPNMTHGAQTPQGPGTRLVFIGIDWERKGLPELYSAFVAARQALPDLSLTVVGAKPPLGEPDGVEVLGRVPHAEIDGILARSDILVLPTHVEAFGIALLSALYRELPCIGTTVSNVPWIIGSGGLCVEPGDIEALAWAIETVASNYPEWKRRAQDRATEVRAQFNWDSVADQILEDLL